MSWTALRNILCFSLFMVYSQTGQCCEKRFAKKRFDAVVPQQVTKGVTILTVKFHGCHLGKHIKLSTDDANFKVRPDGSLYALRALNIGRKYQFKVIAKDQKTHGHWSATVHLTPSAKDITNKPNEVIKKKCPIIYFPAAHKSRRQKREWVIPPVAVMENEWPIINPIAIIKSDKEENEKVFYSISGPGADSAPIRLFVIDHKTGELNITGEVDRERNPYFNLIGKATNVVNSEIETRLSLHIEVLDKNDNAPVFTQRVFEGEVEELASLGTFVLKVNATDADIGENAQIAYRIPSKEFQHLFSARSNGEIQTFGTNLDRETQDLYTLTVQGCDLNGKVGGKCSTTNAQIRILDVNDNVPTAEKVEYAVSVVENSLNDEVTRIKVLDKDQEFTDNWLGHFDIIEGNEGGHFRFEVDEQTNEGILILQKELDYEESQTKNLVVRVSNKAKYHSSVLTGGGGGGGGGGSRIPKPITIKVMVKDKKEGFSFKPTTKRIRITEDGTKVRIGKSFGKYPAISADTGKESERTRYAKNSDPANYFNINPETGEITLNKLPDRESDYVVDGKYTTTILAIDNDGPVPKTATGTIVFDVDDENDNIPIIAVRERCMCEKANSLTITAFDADSYPNAAPYHFKLMDEPDVTNKWKILRRNDTSAELRPLVDLWPYTFNVPIKVEDNQGKGTVQNVAVNVIECTGNDHTCMMRQTGAKDASLGAAAIGLMVLGALLLLLAPLLLLFCWGTGGGRGGPGAPEIFKQIPAAPVGSIANENIEGGVEADTSIPLLPANMSRADGKCVFGVVEGSKGEYLPNSVYTRTSMTGNERGGFGQNIIKEEIGITTSSTIKNDHTSVDDMAVKSIMAKYPRLSQWDSVRRTISGSSFKDYMGSYVNEKLVECSEEDQARPARECLLVYNYEGEGSPAGSLGSCSLIGDETQFKDSDLDDLGPKFKTLADICVGKFESQTSMVSVDPPVQQTFTRTERSISSSSGGLRGLGIITDQLPKQKNYVVTTTINPVEEMFPVIADPPVAHQNVIVTKQVHASQAGMPAMIIDPAMTHQNVITTKQVHASQAGMPAMIIDPAMTHQNVITTKQVHASQAGMPAMIIDPAMTHQNVIMTKQVHASQAGMPAMIIDPAMTHQNVITTKQVHASPGGMPAMIFDPAMTHQNVIVTNQVHASPAGMPAMIFDPALTHQNIIMTKQVHDASAMQGMNMMADPSFTQQNVTMSKSVNISSGGAQGMIADPLFPQLPIVHKNVTLNRATHSGTAVTQSAIADSPLDQLPVIHKNVTLTRPAQATGGGGMNGYSATQPLIQKSSTTRKSVRSTDDVHKTVTKVTKVTQIMQE
ncbi:desmoglein-2-like [Mustelus asterias]